MNLNWIVLCLALGACTSLEYPETYPAPQPQTAAPRNADEIRVDVPENDGDRLAERSQAAAACAQYGRVEVRRGNGEYACVRPDERAPGRD